jgi:dTDP-4-dehydrorhamnose reductase
MILLLGATGYIGQAFATELRRRGERFIPLSRGAFDYTRFELLFDYVRKIKPEFLINAAGVPPDPRQESLEGARREALQANTVLPQTIARVCRINQVPWGHVSTGSLFAGAKVLRENVLRIENDLSQLPLRMLFAAHPERFVGFNETDEPNCSFGQPPCTYWTGTKALAEEALCDEEQLYIWRAGMVFNDCAHPGNLLSALQTMARVPEQVTAVSRLEDFVRTCLDLARRKAPFGIYNIVNPGPATMCHILELIHRIRRPDAIPLNGVDGEESLNGAPRLAPPSGILDTGKLAAAGIALGSSEDAVEDALKKWQTPLKAARASRRTLLAGYSKLLGLAALSCLLAARAGAQAVLSPPPLDFAGVPATLQTTGTNMPAMAPLVQTTPADRPLFDWGPVGFRPHVLYRFSYGDGIPAAPGQNLKTVINEIDPGILLELGRHWRLDYTPTIRLYSNSAFKDTVDQFVSLRGGAAYGDWTFGFAQSYSSVSEPLAETGAQTDTEAFSTALTGVYQMSSALSLELGLNQDFRFASQSVPGETLADTREWSTLNWLDYQFAPTFSAGIGIGLGYDNLSVGSDMTYEQLQGRIRWRPSSKLSAFISGGMETRQFLDTDVPNLVNPICSASVVYLLFEPTTLSFNVNRLVAPAYISDQVTVNTTISGGLRQRLLGKLYLDLDGGYSLVSYHASAAGAEINRTDHTTFFTARLTILVLRRGTASVFYYLSDNSSNEPGLSYSSNQVGFELGYRF